MPGNLLAAAVLSNAVLPLSLSTSYVETQTFPMLSTPPYHDGVVERSLITDGVNTPRVMRTWTLAKRLTTGQISELLTFWENALIQGGLNPFYFYDVYQGVPIGSNYDPTGLSAIGRVTVVFRGDWSNVVDLGARGNIPNLTLVEVA